MRDVKEDTQVDNGDSPREETVSVEVETMKKRKRTTTHFETGWYVPGIENPQDVIDELDEDEEKNHRITLEEFGKLLIDLADDNDPRFKMTFDNDEDKR